MKDQSVAKKNSSGGIALAAIMTMIFVSMGFTVVTPAMEVLGEHFAGQDVTYVSTLPTLFVVFGTAISGAIVGKKAKFRTVAIIANALALVFGVAPMFVDNYIFLLVCRALFGLGLGLLAPLGNALLMADYEGDRLSKYLGYGTFFMSVGGILFQTLGGVFADINWNITFAGHGLFLISFLMSFFIREPEMASGQGDGAEVQASPEGKKEKMSKVVWIPAIVIGIANLCNYPVMLNLSTIFVERGIGTAAIASTALSLYTVAGALAGLLFGWLLKYTKRVTIGIAFVIMALGAYLIWMESSSYIFPTLGCVCLGFGFSTLMPALYNWAGRVTPTSTVAVANSIMQAVTYICSFLSTYWLIGFAFITGDRVYTPILFEVCVFVVFAVIFFIYSPFKDKQEA